MRKLDNPRRKLWLLPLVILMTMVGGCGPKSHVQTVYFPPGSHHTTALYNVNVGFREIGLDRTEVLVSIFEQGRKPYLKREYECRVTGSEMLRSTINWDALDDLRIVLYTYECTSCEGKTLAPDAEPINILKLHFTYDEASGTFTEAPDSEVVPSKWNT